MCFGILWFAKLQEEAGRSQKSNTKEGKHMADFTRKWDDPMLYAKYEITQDEEDYIETLMRPYGENNNDE